MNKSKKIFLCLFLVVFIFVLVNLNLSQEKEQKTINAIQEKQTENESPKQEESKESTNKEILPQDEPQKTYLYDITEILRESQRTFDKSISILNIVVTAMGVLVGLIALIILLAASFGYLENKRYKDKFGEIIKKGEKYLEYIEQLKENAEKQASKIDSKLEKFIIPDIIEEPSEQSKATLETAISAINLMEVFNVPLKPEHYFTRAVYLLEKKEYKDALKNIEIALELDPGNYNKLIQKGICLFSLEQLDKAIETVEKAIDINPNIFYAWQLKGLILSKKDKYEEGIEAINKAIELGGNFATTFEIKGYSLYKLGKNEEAIKVLDKSIELKPNYHAAWHYKGCALFDLGRDEEAFEAFNKAIELKPTNALCWYRRARAYSIKKDRHKMLTDLVIAVKLDPKLKSSAREREDFKDYWDDEEFQKITS